ncbi:MAG: RagB/SusD family nutrient uptake outer membrane protein [Longimicrobiales bacterium]
MRLTALVRRAGTAAGLFGLLAGGALACDSFLETEPQGRLTTENFFQTEDQAIAATNATYSMLRAWQVHVFSWIGLTDIASDDATKGSVPADAGFLLELDNLDFDPGNLAFLDPWTGYYHGIYRANVAIANIPNVPMDEDLKARLIGENKFLRAYFYFFLARAFGGVPLITEPLEPGDFEQPRATREQVYAQIEQDLTDAIGVLPPQSGYAAADIGRATRGAAQAMLAEVHLFQAEYDEAYQNAAAVIGSGEYALFPDYETLFRRDGENSSESVFEVQSVALETRGAGSQYQQVQGVRGTPNIGWGFNTPSDNLEASYEGGDPRLQATIMYPWEMIPDGSGRVVHLNPSMPNNQYNQKVFISPETPGGSGNGGVNIRRIRYAHVLLNGAEAAYHTGNIGDAQTWLNMVRERARGDRSITLGIAPELVSPMISVDRLGLAADESRVFVRFAEEGTPAHSAGLRSFETQCPTGVACTPESVQVLTLDIIRAVDGTPVSTPAEYFAALETKAPGQPVTLSMLRATQAADGTVTTSTFAVTITASALMPAVTATGQALLDAIWHERRSELAMEQHRWFDIVRQGRAAELMAAAGKNFIVGTHELYPIPRNEVLQAGLQQNPGYN